MEGASEAPPPAPVHMKDSTAKPSLETGGRHPRASALNTDLGSDSKLGSSCTGPADRGTWLGPADPGDVVGGGQGTHKGCSRHCFPGISEGQDPNSQGHSTLRHCFQILPREQAQSLTDQDERKHPETAQALPGPDISGEVTTW